MPLLTRKTDYALLALASMAKAENEAISARALADSVELPLPVLRNLLKLLATQGLLRSTRGTKGGYRLARPAREISIATVVEAVEGPIRLLQCCPGPDGSPSETCRLEDTCAIRDNVRRVHDGLIGYLAQVTLAELASEQSEVLTSSASTRPPTSITSVSASAYARPTQTAETAQGSHSR